MSDFGPPIRLPVSIFCRGADMKIKRGGTNGTGNSGSGPRRFHAAPKGLRNPKKPGKHGGGRLLPKPPRAPAIWDPRDPFIISIIALHPAPAPWRSEPRVRMWAPKSRPAPRKKNKRIRKHFDFLDPRRSSFPPYIENINAKEARTLA